MANPFYPSLIPRYVDDSWFSSDQPVDEAARLNELEAHEVWVPDTPYRNVEVQSHSHINTMDGADDDEEGDNMDDEEEGEGIEDDEELDDGEFIPNESPNNL